MYQLLWDKKVSFIVTSVFIVFEHMYIFCKEIQLILSSSQISFVLSFFNFYFIFYIILFFQFYFSYLHKREKNLKNVKHLFNYITQMRKQFLSKISFHDKWIEKLTKDWI